MAISTTSDFVLGPGQLAELMRGFAAPWFMAGGWAIDLFLDRQTRPHSDMEIAIFRRDQARLRDHFHGWEFIAFNAGQPYPWNGGQYLAPPVHEIQATRAVRQSATELTGLEILLNELEGREWRYRRNPAIRLPADELGLTTRSGLPALTPKVALLYKAGDTRPTDDDDFANAVPFMDEADVEWLRAAIATAHPGHHWLEVLEDL